MVLYFIMLWIYRRVKVILYALSGRISLEIFDGTFQLESGGLLLIHVKELVQ